MKKKKDLASECVLSFVAGMLAGMMMPKSKWLLNLSRKAGKAEGHGLAKSGKVQTTTNRHRAG